MAQPANLLTKTPPDKQIKAWRSIWLFNRFNRSLIASIFIACQSLCFSISHAADNPDITAIPLEDLPNTTYIPASRIAQQLHNASSAVAIVTAQDIRAYGYRNLGEILNSMRGLFVTQDLNFTFVGGRGYGKPADYAGKVLLFIDGYRAQDGYFEQAFFGQDGIIDVNLIDRVEYVPGPGAAGYGDGASLGVINVYTKKGSDINGMQVASNFGSHNAHQERFSFGKQLENGADILLSASKFNSSGRDFSFFDSLNDETINQNGDHGEDNLRLFLKANYGNWLLEGAWAKQRLEIPSFPWGGIVDSPYVQTEENRFIRLKYDSDINNTNKLLVNTYYGLNSNPFKYPSTADYSKYTSEWYGVDTQLINTSFTQHTLLFGVEYRRDNRQDFYLLQTDPFDPTDPSLFFIIDDKRDRKTYSIYGYDDYAITTKLNINFGGRYTRSDNDVHLWSPRGSIIYKPVDGTALKLSTGISQRQATPFEGGSQPGLQIKPEVTRTTELTWEQDLGWQSRLTASAYRYSIRDGIVASSYDKPIINTKGLELQYEKVLSSGTRLRTSWITQSSIDGNNQRLEASPRNIFKLNLTTPLLGERLRAGLDVRGMSSRPTVDPDIKASGYTVADLTFSSINLLPHLNASLSIKNLFDRKYGDVILPYSDGSLTFPQDGRNYWLQLEYTFK